MSQNPHNDKLNYKHISKSFDIAIDNTINLIIPPIGSIPYEKIGESSFTEDTHSEEDFQGNTLDELLNLLVDEKSITTPSSYYYTQTNNNTHQNTHQHQNTHTNQNTYQRAHQISTHTQDMLVSSSTSYHMSNIELYKNNYNRIVNEDDEENSSNDETYSSSSSSFLWKKHLREFTSVATPSTSTINKSHKAVNNNVNLDRKFSSRKYKDETSGLSISLDELPLQKLVKFESLEQSRLSKLLPRYKPKQRDTNTHNETQVFSPQIYIQGDSPSQSYTQDSLQPQSHTHNEVETQDHIYTQNESQNNIHTRCSSTYLTTTNNELNTEHISSVYFPGYYAHQELANLSHKIFNPTVDLFINSLKVQPYSLLFNSLFLYIDLLHLLPCFTLPLYDPGVIQYVCEDIALHSRFTGLEVPFRLLTHDIWFLAMYAYMSDIPTWARPPINLLRIYKFQAIQSYQDIDELHTTGLVYHNIHTIFTDYSESLDMIELNYPEGFSINSNPYTHFQDFTHFVGTLGFQLKEIVFSEEFGDEGRENINMGCIGNDSEDNDDKEDVDGLFHVRQEYDCVYDGPDNRGVCVIVYMCVLGDL